MGREIRNVPMDYVHPLTESGAKQPMYDQTYPDALLEYEKDVKEHVPAENDGHSATEWLGEPPSPAYYHQEWPRDAVMGIQLWEDTSEGTPLSPVFSDTEQGRVGLAEWAEKNATTFGISTTSRENWYRMLFDESVGVYHEVIRPDGIRMIFM